MTTKDGRKVVTLYLEPDLHRAVKVRAAEGGVRITDLIIRAIEAALERGE